jgi:hypothetical protein
MFFSYEQLMNLSLLPAWSWDVEIFSVHVGRINIRECVWIVVGLTAGRWLQKASGNATATATLALNRLGAALVVLGTLSAGRTSYASGHAQTFERRPGPTDPGAASAIHTRAPDGALPVDFFLDE